MDGAKPPLHPLVKASFCGIISFSDIKNVMHNVQIILESRRASDKFDVNSGDFGLNVN